MSRWEYQKLDFGVNPRCSDQFPSVSSERVQDIDVGIAYQKRKIPQLKRTTVIKPSAHAKTSEEYKLIG